MMNYIWRTFANVAVAPDILAGKNLSKATEHCFKNQRLLHRTNCVLSIETCQQCWTKQQAGMNHLTAVVSVRWGKATQIRLCEIIMQYSTAWEQICNPTFSHYFNCQVTHSINKYLCWIWLLFKHLSGYKKEQTGAYAWNYKECRSLMLSFFSL